MCMIVFPLFLVYGVAHAEWIYPVKVKHIGTFSSGEVMFDTDGTPSSVCNYQGYRFKLDVNQKGWKNMLSTLLAAQLTGRVLGIGYTVSSVPGTDYTNGCTTSNMAVVTIIIMY